MDKKQQQSKKEYGTVTAKLDANNDYESAQNGSATATSSKQESAKQKASKAEYGTMTAKADANNDYK